MRRGVGSRHRCSLPISISIFVVHENERGDGGRAGLCSKRLGRRCAGSNVRAQLLGRLVPTEVQVISQFKNSLTDFSKHFKNQKRSTKSGILLLLRAVLLKDEVADTTSLLRSHPPSSVGSPSSSTTLFCYWHSFLFAKAASAPSFIHIAIFVQGADPIGAGNT